MSKKTLGFLTFFNDFQVQIDDRAGWQAGGRLICPQIFLKCQKVKKPCCFFDILKDFQKNVKNSKNLMFF